MSLVQHVSAVEGPDRVDLASLYDPPDNASLQLGRRLSLTLSYDPIPRADAAHVEKAEPVGAYKISTAKRIGELTRAYHMILLLISYSKPRSPLESSYAFSLPESFLDLPL
jgi:hypothetical protein